ncbi:MAG: hypothetical protein IJV94_02870 [Bacilli bacterium]|nr:hypothetical protein [Bacilli bacterium]
MKRDVVMPGSQFSSSFLSCEKDIEEILRKLFISSKPYSDYLKKLLVINTQDCLDNTESVTIQQKIADMSLAKMRQEGYIKLEPKIRFGEHEEVKSYIIISCDNFTPNATNPHYRDCTVTFDIICHTDCWDIGNYRIRPLKIAGYIDGILNKARLSGIGTFQFMGCNQLILNEELSGYTLMYRAVHGNDDKIAAEEE